jgi:outer membrane protein assembly factor BamB
MAIFLALAAGVVTFGIVSGCASSSSARESDAIEREHQATVRKTNRTLDDLDRTLLIGPTAATKLDYRNDWNTAVIPNRDSGIDLLSVEGDSVFTSDGENHITRIRATDGQLLWPVPVGDLIDNVHGVVYMPAADRVYVQTDAHLHVLDAANGSLLAKHHLNAIASTEPQPFGSSMIYGARNGQVVWYAYQVGEQIRAYQIAKSLKIAPLVEGNYLVAIGSDGEVNVLSAPHASTIWRKKLLAPVEAQPAIGQDTLFVASLDQHLYAFNLADGRTLWRYLTESPLNEPPVIIDDRVYQQVPGEGLVCLTARPNSDFDGNVIWTSPDARGNVIGEHGVRLMLWDDDARTLTTVDRNKGYVMDTIALPGVKHLHCTDVKSGDLYAAGDDGRLAHLVPTSRVEQAVTTGASASRNPSNTANLQASR